MLRRIDGLLAAALVIGLVAAVAWLARPEFADGVVRVVDGDTIEMGARRIRLVGIDAPERGQGCGAADRPVPCGEIAREAMRSLVAGRPVACRVTGRDKWQRDLATCRVGDRDLGAAMVEGGHAVADGRYAAEERVARDAKRGIWAGPFERPSLWRREHRP